MKKPLAWITDSMGFITEELKEHPDVYVVPLNIHFGQETFEDAVDLTSEELYDRLRGAEEFPKTSQPSAGKFAELYNRLKEEYECAIAVHGSSRLSGTLASSVAGAEMADFPLYAVDSLALSYGMTGLIERGFYLQEQGLVPEKIAAQLQNETVDFRNFITIGNLSQLYKGGRMNGVQYYLGSLLKVKPIVQITEEGELAPIDKVRSQKKAMQYLVDRATESYREHGSSKFQILHANVIAEAVELREEILKVVPHAHILIGELSTVLVVHAGEGTIALLWRSEPAIYK
ncbi:DegV family protein [Planococcus lenghuensis]|uniref:Fatty acid-binding protein DegV n=1 Tax=Planococcus lenghuensis TaxID=2213202 RepID=A0A1Q2L1M0_9BACL|nr:DegV family protein [Planococcus lenghuensis]AQQ54365.1 fatty acid-binding protein DegV [Planococcus lenghuensis]